MPDGNGHGRWPRPAPGDLDPRPGRGGRAVTLTGAPARGRCRPGCAGRGAGHQHKPAHKSAPQRPRRLAQRHSASVKLTLVKTKCTVAFMKHYGQACAIARALDIVGERWSLLLVRELTLGPRRYRDLATGLPGIPSNVLAARLKDLQAAGVLTPRTLPPPAAAPPTGGGATRSAPAPPTAPPRPPAAPWTRSPQHPPARHPPRKEPCGNQPAPPRQQINVRRTRHVRNTIQDHPGGRAGRCGRRRPAPEPGPAGPGHRAADGGAGRDHLQRRPAAHPPRPGLLPLRPP